MNLFENNFSHSEIEDAETLDSVSCLVAELTWSLYYFRVMAEQSQDDNKL